MKNRQFHFLKPFYFLLLSLWASAAWSGPRLVVNEESWDFGEAPNQGVINHVFKLSNAGDSLLKIVSVHGSCGCLATKVENKELKPGDTVGVTVSFNCASVPRGGRFTKSATVVMGGEIPPKMLTVTGVVNPIGPEVVTVDPKVVNWMRGKASWNTMRLRNLGGEVQRVGVLEKTGLVDEVKVNKTLLHPGAGALVKVKLREAGEGFAGPSLTLWVRGGSGERRITVPVIVRDSLPSSVLGGVNQAPPPGSGSALKEVTGSERSVQMKSGVKN